jgi:hypothetical protein
VSDKRKPSKWPLILIGASAAVAVWSGWVGLGVLSGFGVIHPLPGIWDAFHLNTAITLPIGVEAYGATALGAWLDPRTPKAARKFAKRSAIGSLALGMLGQVAYHLLTAYHFTAAPWWIVMLVSCLPVVTLGFAAALHHLRNVEDEPQPEPETAPTVAVELPQPAEPEPLPWPTARGSSPVHVGKDAWVESPDFAGTFVPPQERRDDPVAVPAGESIPPDIVKIPHPAPNAVNDAIESPVPVTDPYPTGQMHVSSPLSRLDRKVPGELRNTGTFPVTPD